MKPVNVRVVVCRLNEGRERGRKDGAEGCRQEQSDARFVRQINSFPLIALHSERNQNHENSQQNRDEQNLKS